MRIYIAGPMTGLPELNFPAFRDAAARLRAEGHEVVNPAEINVDPSAGWLECMRADIRELVTCDAVYLLPGWEKSRGARLESQIAQGLGFEVLAAPVDGCDCRTCRPITISAMRFVVCAVCGNKRCPHANDHRHACTGSNQPGQAGSAYA